MPIGGQSRREDGEPQPGQSRSAAPAAPSPQLPTSGLSPVRWHVCTGQSPVEDEALTPNPQLMAPPL